jgi:hypothetical protein
MQVQICARPDWRGSSPYVNSFDLHTHAADKDTARWGIDAFSGKNKKP